MYGKPALDPRSSHLLSPVTEVGMARDRQANARYTAHNRVRLCIFDQPIRALPSDWQCSDTMETRWRACENPKQKQDQRAGAQPYSCFRPDAVHTNTPTVRRYASCGAAHTYIRTCQLPYERAQPKYR